KIIDTDIKLNSLKKIYDQLENFFHNCNEQDLTEFVTFFQNCLYDILNKCINEEFDELRNFTIDIYFLLEKNLNDKLLSDILFGTSTNKENNFFFLCINRLKEKKEIKEIKEIKEKKSIEEKEGIRLKLIQFLNKIVNRYIHKNDQTYVQDVFNMYMEDMLLSFNVLVKDPFVLVKKHICQLLYILDLDQHREDLICVIIM
ncbi:hypothetical protein HEP_00508800, partial [Hepatocystis sp. ex Piliocolobus tephrosceles]